MPVFESHLIDYSNWGVGPRICEHRQRRGLTLQEVAARSGVSTARLSQIENGLYVPDVKQAHDIASALGLTIDFLVPSDRALPYQIKRYREVRESAPLQWQQPDETKDCELWPLADLFVGRQMEPMLVRLTPGQESPFRHYPGLEFAFVLKGRVEFRLKAGDGEHREELQRGDCIYIRSHHLHTFRCLDDQPAECIHVLSSPSPGGLCGFEWLPHASNGRRNGNGPGAADVVGTDLPTLLGRELSALRRARRWTTAELAHVAGIRERQVEQVENGERTPPLDVLVKLARAFGRPLRELLHDPREQPPYYVVRRSTEIPALRPRPRRVPTDRPDAPMPNSYHPLFDDFPTVHMYPYSVKIRNVDMQMLVPHDHHGQEFVYMLQWRNRVSHVRGGPDGEHCAEPRRFVLSGWNRAPPLAG